VISEKLFILFSIILAIIFSTGFMNDAAGSDWVYYATNMSGNKLFYDKDSIRSDPQNIIRVWGKTVYSDKGRAHIIDRYMDRGISTTGYESLGESKELYHFNCADEKLTVSELVNYASDGRVLDSRKSDKMDWIQVTPDSWGEKLLKIVCKEAQQKK